ncbi:TrkH family potassium uptake protein [Nanoarchaeota archaeon]
MRIVLKYLGYLLLIFSVFPIIPIITAIIYHEPFLPFLALIVISLVLGFMLVNWRRDEKRLSITSFDIPRSISLTALSFILISTISTLPYMLIQRVSFLDALFESVSGFTTTGLTILTDVESVSRSLLMWRAETQWIGGLSVVLLFLVIVSAMRRQDSLKETTTKARAIANLYQAQGASERLEANMKKSIRSTMIIYGCYSIVGIFLLYIAGLSIFESISVGFTAISTAGFSVTNEFYTSWPVIAVVSFLMLAGGISFVVHNRLLKGYIHDLWRDGTLKFYLGMVIMAVLIVMVFVGDIKVALFETISAFTTTGYSIADINLLPAIVIFILLLGMMFGGMIGSTCGGIKSNRLKLVLKSIPWMVRKTCSPSGAIIPMKNDGMPVDNENMLITQAYIACYILILLLGTAILMITGISFLHSAFQTVSALGGVGLSTATLAAFNPIAKIVLIIAMLFGRLEIIPLLVLGKFSYDRIRIKLMKQKEAARKLFYIKLSPSELWKRKL